MRVAIIPARGGSKRIPGKNIRRFHGKPIIAYSIEAARETYEFDRVIVSTDDDQIAEVAHRFGAEVSMRSAALSDDHATLGDVMQQVVKGLSAEHPSFTAACCILATAPFIRVDDLLRAIEKFESDNYDYVFSAFRVGAVVQQTFYVNDAGRTEMFFPHLYRARSQDLAPAYFDAAHFYLGKPIAWLENRTIFTSNASMVEVPVSRFHDIDNESDWVAAEQAFVPPPKRKVTA